MASPGAERFFSGALKIGEALGLLVKNAERRFEGGGLERDLCKGTFVLPLPEKHMRPSASSSSAAATPPSHHQPI
jgi:hypothetical protein